MNVNSRGDVFLLLLNATHGKDKTEEIKSANRVLNKNNSRYKSTFYYFPVALIKHVFLPLGMSLPQLLHEAVLCLE